MKYLLPMLLLLSLAVAAETLPNTPMPQQFADHTVIMPQFIYSKVTPGPEFYISTGLLFASTVADEELAKSVESDARFHARCIPGEVLVINKHHKGHFVTAPCSSVASFSPAVTTGDSRLRYYAFNLAADAAVTYLDYRMKKSNNKLAKRLWYAPAAVLTGFHVGYMFSNVERVR